MADVSFKPLMESRGIRLAQLARDLGVNKSTISRWKSVPTDRLEDVSKITGIPVTQLRPDIPWGMVK